jgi:nicotinate dehydrogenase subunit A
MPDECVINGQTVRLPADSDLSLLSFLRDTLDLTGAKYGCGEGQCGACTVLVDGVAVRSCITKARTLAGKRITTIEGLAPNGTLDPVQRAFLDVEAFECAYCTPGMIMSATSLLRRNPNPSPAEIVRGMEGNICRCGEYPRIVAAVQRAAAAMKEVSGNE